MAKIQKKSKQQFHLIPFFLFSTQRLSIRGGSYPHSALPLARARTAATEQTMHVLPQNAQMQVQGVQQSLLHQQSERAPTLQSSHGTRRTHRTFWQIRASHRLHRFSQIRRVWHPCHTHAATKLSSHGIHGTQKQQVGNILPQIAQMCTD